MCKVRREILPNDCWVKGIKYKSEGQPSLYSHRALLKGIPTTAEFASKNTIDHTEAGLNVL